MTIQEIAEKIVDTLRNHGGNEKAQTYDVADILRNVPVEPGDDRETLGILELKAHYAGYDITCAMNISGDNRRAVEKATQAKQDLVDLADRYRLRMAQQQEIREALDHALTVRNRRAEERDEWESIDWLERARRALGGGK